MSLGLLLVPDGKSNVVPLLETVQVALVAQIKVIPLVREGEMRVPPQLYEPLAKVTVAPSLALPTTVFTSEGVVSEGQDQDVPLPEHAACAGIDHKIQIAPTRQAIRRIITLSNHSKTKKMERKLCVLVWHCPRSGSG